MKKSLVFSASALAIVAFGLAGQAKAADLDPPAPVPAPEPVPFVQPQPWAGLYFGVQGGYVFEGEAGQSFSNGAASGDSDPDGFIVGGHVGYLFQNGNVVFGIEGDGEYSDVDGSFTTATSTGSVDIEAQGSGRGVLGYSLGSVLPYITGGVAIAGVDYRGSTGLAASSGFSETAIGYTVGGGLRVALTENIDARVEYRYTDFGSERGTIGGGASSSIDLETHAVRGGISFKFDSLLGGGY